MSRRTTFTRFAVLGAIVLGLVAFSPAPTAMAKPKKADKSGKKEKHAGGVSGTVQTISKTEITLLVGGDKTKIKVYLIDDKTQITGDVVRGGNATVTADGNKAKSISAG